MRSVAALYAFLALGLAMPAFAAPKATGGSQKVLFLGSSTIWFWRESLESDFPRATTVNLGEGGTDFRYMLENAGDWVSQHPDTASIVVYSGENDIANGVSAAEVARGFHRVAELLHERLPRAELYVISIKPSLLPERLAKLRDYEKANDLLESTARKLGYVTYLDTHTPMFGTDGKPRRELFRADELHMAAEGYRVWREVVAPSLAPCDEAEASMARLEGNAGEIYKLTARTGQLSRMEPAAKLAVGRIGARVKAACARHAEAAKAADRAALLVKAEGQEGAFENGASLVASALAGVKAAREAALVDYKAAADEAGRFAVASLNQAMNVKAPAGEKAQLRREALGGRRLTAQAARKLISVDHRLSQEALRLETLGEQLLQRWERLATAGEGKLKAAREAQARLKAERERQDEAALALARR